MRRITVDLADDVRAMIEQVRRERGMTFKEVVNEAMRRGFIIRERERAAAEAKAAKAEGSSNKGKKSAPRRSAGG